MNENRFSGIRACVFDAYGTLFDVHSAVGRHRARLAGAADAVSALWRTKQLEYTWLRTLMGHYVDFWQITGDALDYALETHEIGDAGLREDLMAAYLTLDSYPEVPEVLAALRGRGFKLAILSNGSPRMLAAAVDSAGLGELLDASLSVDSLRSYKPLPAVYQLACDRLGVTRAQISFQSSNAWDAAGAAAFGMNVAWINRFGQRAERLPGKPAAELHTLSELPPLLDD
jgi:2-haloacid dehalogenase